jgi:hypothetical protein
LIVTQLLPTFGSAISENRSIFGRFFSYTTLPLPVACADTPLRRHADSIVAFGCGFAALCLGVRSSVHSYFGGAQV